MKDDETDTRKTWLFLDEFSKMGKLTGFDDLITNGRSKGVCLALAFQNIQGVTEVYGEKLADEIISECGSKAFLKCDGETARWASNEIGKSIKEKRSKSLSGSNTLLENKSSVQFGETTDSREEDVVFPSDFAGFPIANKENGVGGFYISSWISGVWKHQQQWKQNGLGEVAQISSSEPTYLDRSKNPDEQYYQFLHGENWKEERLTEFGKNDEKVGNARQATNQDDILKDLEKRIQERRNKRK